MKTLRLLPIVLLLSVLGFSQAARFDLPAFGSGFINGVKTVTPLQGATVRVCTYPGLCDDAHLTTIYTDATGITPTANPFTADANGMMGYWILPANHQYTFTYRGTTFGPYVVTMIAASASTATTATTATTALSANKTDKNDKSGVNAKTDCGVTGDGSTIDDIAGCAAANPTRRIFLPKLRSTACSSGTGGSCIGTVDYYITAPIVLGDGQVLECETSGAWPNGAVKIKKAVGIAGVILAGYGSKVKGCILDEQDYWVSTSLATFDDFSSLEGSGDDGFVMVGGITQLENVAAYGQGRHGIFIAGNSVLTPAWGYSGQPDGFYINGAIVHSNRGWGIYSNGPDANAGTAIAVKTYGNQFGGIFDNSWFGSAWIGAMSHIDNRSAVTAGANAAISTIQRTSNITTYTGAAVAGTVASGWVTCSGTTNYNRTMKIAAFTSTASFTLTDAGVDLAQETAGNCKKASSDEVFAYQAAKGGDFALLGAYASANGSNVSSWYNPYCELTSNYPKFGTLSVIHNGEGGHGCDANLPAGTVHTGVWLGGLGNGYQIKAVAGAELTNPLNGGNSFFQIKSGSSGGSTGARGVRFLKHDDTVDFRLVTLTSTQVMLDCGTLGFGLQLVKTGAAILNPCTMTQDVRIGYNNGAWTGKFQIYSDTTKVREFDPATGSATLLTANGAQWVQGQNSELLTLSTSGATTDTTANLLPANSIIEAVVCRVTTTITTATDWSVGDGTTAARFSSANATLVAGTTSVGLNHQKGAVTTDAAGPTQVSAAKVRITTTGTPGAGAIRITVFYRSFVAPTS